MKEKDYLDQHDQIFISNLQILSKQLREISEGVARKNKVLQEDLDSMKTIFLRIGAFIHGLEANNKD
jgi:hypothetical protein